MGHRWFVGVGVEVLRGKWFRYPDGRLETGDGE